MFIEVLRREKYLFCKHSKQSRHLTFLKRIQFVSRRKHILVIAVSLLNFWVFPFCFTWQIISHHLTLSMCHLFKGCAKPVKNCGDVKNHFALHGYSVTRRSGRFLTHKFVPCQIRPSHSGGKVSRSRTKFISGALITSMSSLFSLLIWHTKRIQNRNRKFA